MIHHMHNRFRRRLLGSAVALLPILLTCSAALGQDDEKVVDARLQGYPQRVAIEKSSTALTWLLFVVLGGVCVGVMFINAKRTRKPEDNNCDAEVAHYSAACWRLSEIS